VKAKDIAYALAKSYTSPFYARKFLAVVPNVSWGMLAWEADLLVCTKFGYLSEIEIKISFSDWKSDPEKAKFANVGSFGDWSMIKSFWYAAPLRLALRHQEIEGLRFGYGVLGVEIDDNGDYRVSVVRKAMESSSARKLTDKEQLQLCRLGALKAWNHRKPEVAA
jgi:hypothetical protein